MSNTLKFSKYLTFDNAQLYYIDMVNLYTRADQLILDLTKVEKFDSAGLALLIEANRLSKVYNVTLLLKGMPEIIYNMAKLCGVEQLLATVDISSK